MRLLLDTNALILALADEERLSLGAQQALHSLSNEVYFSAVNIWEIEIKVKTGKLERPVDDIVVVARGTGWRELPITARHATATSELDLHHSDPFDRLLIAQARCEGLTIVTSDRVFDRYDVPILRY